MSETESVAIGFCVKERVPVVVNGVQTDRTKVVQLSQGGCMKEVMGRMICWILGCWHHNPRQGHHWRRLHKREVLNVTADVVEMIGRNGGIPSERSVRRCRRCGLTRIARRRNRVTQ